MIKKIFAAVFLGLAIGVAIIGFQPSHFSVARSTMIRATPEVIFLQINNLKNWDAWSPWAKLDPNAVIRFEGPAEGVNASFSWSGGYQVGVGTMTIIKSEPAKFVQYRLDFKQPFEGTNTAEFTLIPEGELTQVTWSMSGENTFISKGIGLFMDLDANVGGQFEKGLAKMKAVVEAMQ